MLAFLINNQSTNAADPQSSFAVVELFTSEGCSSCPSADAVLVELQKRADQGEAIFCLGYHVDYWDKLGWRDTYSSKEATTRQKTYAALFGNSSIYTPQMVVNGEVEFVGSDRKKAYSTVDAALKQTPTLTLSINPVVTDDYNIIVAGTTSKPSNNTTAYCFLVVTTGINNVTRGENSGRKLSHVAMVLDLASTKLEGQKLSSVTLKSPVKIDRSKHYLITFIQQNETGKIISATKSNFK